MPVRSLKIATNSQSAEQVDYDSAALPIDYQDELL